MESPAFEFEHLEVRYGPATVLRGVSGRVRQGEILLVSGRNGSGKSTLLRCLAGLQRPRAGRFGWSATAGDSADPSGRGTIGWLGPELQFYPELSVQENLALFRTLRRLPLGDELPVLRELGLPADRRVAALSSGMLQRLRWVWALQGDPRLLLLDEPFQNLDPAGTAALSARLADHLLRGCAIVATPSPLVLPDAPLAHLSLDD